MRNRSKLFISILVLSLFVSVPSFIAGIFVFPSVKGVQISIDKYKKCKSNVSEIYSTGSHESSPGKIAYKCVCKGLERTVIGNIDYTKFKDSQPDIGEEVILWCRDDFHECFWVYSDKFKNDLPFMRRYYFVFILITPFILSFLFLYKLIKEQ